MQLDSPGRPHLTYCTNIHPGESLAEVSHVVETHVAAVKAKVGPHGPFGVGLRLSARAAEELERPAALSAFRALLERHGLYVFTINGFPYGAFHGTRVKESVYRPDWLEDERVAYTDRLARILAELLPEGVSGSISTVPGAFRPRASGAKAGEDITERLVRHAVALHGLFERTGKRVELALEPEPACFLETTADVVEFFRECVFGARAIQSFSARTGTSGSVAEEFLRRHLGICLDACHFAVEFESATEALDRIQGGGIRIGKIQVTVAPALRLGGTPIEDAKVLGALASYADPVYLHQVVVQREGQLTRFTDLPEALGWAAGRAPSAPEEWRVHFHVPVYAAELAPFTSTQPFLRELLSRVRAGEVSPHLEVETYTWDVLPRDLREADVDDAIARELQWTLGELGSSRPPPGQRPAP